VHVKTRPSAPTLDKLDPDSSLPGFIARVVSTGLYLGIPGNSSDMHRCIPPKKSHRHGAAPVLILHHVVLPVKQLLDEAS